MSNVLTKLPKTLFLYMQDEGKVDIGEGLLDVQPHCSEVVANQAECKYSLCSVADQLGALRGGHYTATCQSPVTEKWLKISDTCVEEAEAPRGPSSEAYLLFYKRMG